jgi:DNA-directed RNA polymerase II subunit RPB1
MNGHFPLSVITRNEINQMMSVGERMISLQYGKPMVGLYQDSLIGAAEFSTGKHLFNKFHAMQMFSDIIDSQDIPNFKNNVYSNYEIISLLLPKINFNKTPSSYDQVYAPYIKYDKEDIKVNIKDGEYFGGILDKASVGRDTSGSIIHIIGNQFGSRTALKFIHNAQQVIANHTMLKGFSLGIADMIISKEALSKVHHETAGFLLESNRITEKLNNNEIIPPIGLTVEEFYEEEQWNALSIADGFTETIIGSIDAKNNSLFKLIMSGSKGNKGNLLAISSAIGSQSIDGQRIKQTFG